MERGLIVVPDVPFPEDRFERPVAHRVAKDRIDLIAQRRILRRRDGSAMDDGSHLTQQKSLPLLLQTRNGNSRPVVVGVSKAPPAVTVILVISR